MNMVEKALLVAATAHGAVGQKRKYTGEDYIYHSIEVSNILYDYGHTDDYMHAAALMHDCVEDTGLTIEYITDIFGPVVGSLVEGLTDVSKPEDGNRAKRKAMDREHTAKQSVNCKTIKLADMISNSRSILEHDKDFAKVYLKEKQLLLEVTKDADPAMWAEANRIVEEGMKELCTINK